MTETTAHHIETARVRRSPRYAVFLVVGALLGILVAAILTFAVGDGVDKSATTEITYTTGQVFGFLALVGVAVGLAVGGIVALLLDRSFSRRTREVRVDRERVEHDPAAG